MKRGNPKGCQLARGFILGMAYAKGHSISTEKIRREIRVSKATAKRDMKVIRALVPTLPSKPVAGMVGHVAQRTR